MPLPTTPEGVINDAIGSSVARYYGLTSVPEEYRKPPAEGWNLNAFDKLVAGIPRTPGAAAPGTTDYSVGWMKPLKDHLVQSEDVRYTSYNDSKGFRTVGIGFNLDRKGGREDFKRALGVDDAFYDAVYKGSQRLSDRQVQALLDYDIPKLHGQLLKDTGGRNLPDNQTAALLSLAFNYGYAGMKKLGVLDLVLGGRLHEAVNKTANLPGSRSRRLAEAKLLGGLDAHISLN